MGGFFIRMISGELCIFRVRGPFVTASGRHSKFVIVAIGCDMLTCLCGACSALERCVGLSTDSAGNNRRQSLALLRHLSLPAPIESSHAITPESDQTSGTTFGCQMRHLPHVAASRRLVEVSLCTGAVLRPNCAIATWGIDEVPQQ